MREGRRERGKKGGRGKEGGREGGIRYNVHVDYVRGRERGRQGGAYSARHTYSVELHVVYQ